MKKVGFLGGYRVLDDKLYDRISLVIEGLASKESELEFMFFYSILTGIIIEKDTFMEECYQAVENFRTANPDKKVVRTLLIRNPEEVEAWREKYNSYDMYDRGFFPVEDKKSVFIKAVIHHADYMICQLYSNILDKTEQKIFNMVEEEARIMVTSEEVERRIKELISRLPKSTQYIFDRVNAGEQYISLAKELGIGPDAIRARHINAIINIQKCLAGQKSYFD